VLAGLLTALAFAVLGQFVVTSARRRPRDFAILRAIGMTRGQLSAVTAWQVTTLTGLALLVGVPLGWPLVTGHGGSSPVTSASRPALSRRCR
jgi:putative ABC transport system permease protein